MSVLRTLRSRLASLADRGSDARGDADRKGTGTGRSRSTGDGPGRSTPAPTAFPPGDPLREFDDRWEPAERGVDRYVVYPPTDGPTNSIRRCSTLDETRRRLEFWYGEGAVGDADDGRSG